MKLEKVTISEPNYDKHGNIILTLTIPRRFKAVAENLKDNPYNVEIKKYREKRSLNANAYAWELMGKLAEVTKIRVDDIYREYIRNVGGNSVTICVQETKADRICRDWEKNGLGWQAIQFDSKIDGCVNLLLYEGSSEFDTAQMSRMIDMIIQDCKEQDIETATPDELLNMKSQWKGMKIC